MTVRHRSDLRAFFCSALEYQNTDFPRPCISYGQYLRKISIVNVLFKKESVSFLIPLILSGTPFSFQKLTLYFSFLTQKRNPFPSKSFPFRSFPSKMIFGFVNVSIPVRDSGENVAAGCRRIGRTYPRGRVRW